MLVWVAELMCCCCCVVSRLSRTFRTAMAPPTLVFSPLQSCCRWQLTLNGKCLWRTWNCLSSSRATSLPENSHKMSLEAQVKQMEPTGRGERGDLAGNGLISYCVATCAFCSYDWIFNSICCTNISTSLPPFPSSFLSILLRAKSLRCWQTFLF